MVDNILVYKKNKKKCNIPSRCQLRSKVGPGPGAKFEGKLVCIRANTTGTRGVKAPRELRPARALTL